MSCSCSESPNKNFQRLARSASREEDPSRTIPISNRWEKELNRRWKAVARQIIAKVRNENAFGITANRAFDFPTDQARVDAFMNWLRTVLDAQIYDGQIALPRSVAVSQAWANVYIQTAYRRGLLNGASQLRRAGVTVAPGYTETAFLRPVHADTAGLAYLRSYESLNKVTNAMGQQMRETLAEGLADGVNPETLARRLVDRVEKIGLTRSRLIARTEVAFAQSEAQLNVFQDAAVQNIGLDAEWLTAGDNKVCSQCENASLNGPYTIPEARGMIPLHPNCRCAWIPLVRPGSNKTLT